VVNSKKIRDYIHSEKARFIKFAVVGVSGIFVNEGLLALFTEVYGLKVEVAGAIAIEASILSNFFLNNFWTWQDSHDKSFTMRLLQYHSVSIIAGVVNYLILVGLTMLGMHHLIANLIGIGFATLINFILNNHWTFAKKISQEIDGSRQ
jgi:dolichol-phosphate mannosyltransferase